MNKKLILLAVASILLGACKTTTFMKPPLNQPSDDASIKLAEAASSISESMAEMAQVEKVIYLPNEPYMTKSRLVAVSNARSLQTRATIDWSGPIGELTARIAKSANYRMRILGNEPAIPVLVNVSVKDQSLAEILRNIDYQAGKKANLTIYPNSHIIELRYVKIYS